MRIHTLPNDRATNNLWKTDSATEAVEEAEAYQAMLDNGELDKCGVTLLAGKAVDALFVDAVATSLALSEIPRLPHGASVNQARDIDYSPEFGSVLKNADVAGRNSGF
ncbi:MAG: hypothetical protein ABR991_04300 [Terracidiphilus sp.]